MIGFWTDERVDVLKKLWIAGLSGAQVAKEIGDGCSRNAVIGRAHRMNLAGRPKPEPRPKVPRKPRLVRANGNSNQMRVTFIPDAAMPTLRAVDIVPLHISLLDLQRDHCRAPYGDLEITFCGHPKLEGSPAYCQSHHRLYCFKPHIISDAERERRVRLGHAAAARNNGRAA